GSSHENRVLRVRASTTEIDFGEPFRPLMTIRPLGPGMPLNHPGCLMATDSTNECVGMCQRSSRCQSNCQYVVPSASCRLVSHCVTMTTTSSSNQTEPICAVRERTSSRCGHLKTRFLAVTS